MKRLALAALATAVLLPATAQAQEWLTFGEAGAQIRNWGRVTADDLGDTITRQKVDLCRRSTAVRVVCWYDEEGYNRDGSDYTCGGAVRVIEYATHYNRAPIKHGRFRFRCF